MALGVCVCVSVCTCPSVCPSRLPARRIGLRGEGHALYPVLSSSDLAHRQTDRQTHTHTHTHTHRDRVKNMTSSAEVSVTNIGGLLYDFITTSVR